MERRARWIAVATVFAAATLCATGVAHAQTETYVALFGDARSIVGPQSLLFTSADSSIVLRSGTHGGGMDAATFDIQRGSDDWRLVFTAPAGTALRPGVYDDVGDSSDGTRADLHLSGEGRDCGEGGGRFEIKDIAADGQGNIGRLWAVYEYHCGSNPWSGFGEVKYNEPAPDTGADAAPSIVRWPSADFGYARATVPVTVRAAGVSRVTGVAIDGPQANDFAVRDDGCSGTSLAAGATCRVSVAWSPRAAGTRIATLHVALASGQVLDVPLQGFMYSGTTRYQFSGGPAGSGTESYTPGTAQLDISGADTVVRLEVRDIDNGTTFWDATFSPRPGDTLRPGSYDNAARYPFNGSQPGMDVNGHGSGCNTVSGHFTVREATYNRYDEVQSFAVDFVQYCDGDPSNEWRGSLDYRSGDTAARPPWITGAAAPGAPGGGGATPTRPAASGTGAAASTPSSTAQRATRTLRAALARRLRAALRARRRLTLTLPAGRLRLTWRARGHVLARGRRTWRRAGRCTVVVHLTASGRRELRRHPHRPITVTASLRLASGGRPIVVSVVSRR